MKYLIADDEPLARQRAKRLMGNLSGFDCCGMAEHGAQVLELVNQENPDVLLLDIDMPGLSGLEVAQRLSHSNHNIKIVFVTAHPEFALDAFHVFASGFLVKPVQFEQLEAVMSRFYSPKIQYQLAGQTRSVDVAQIMVAKAEDKYTHIWFEGGEAVIDESLKSLLATYPQAFIQIHRNTLVRRNAIESLRSSSSGLLLKLKGFSELLPVSRRAAKDLKGLI
ncbi:MULTISPECIES: LytR/AlgR family response regulator transcription factor [Pseudoalteromonas]|uniref:Two-component system, LytT family, response regulator AlgR n=1 Tax=Pseudoalteromonas aurantia 208 TaxID=1314867 RepID=A0ABR9E8G0_9GAMM|nr:MULTISPECIES: LytTR family DNA-binding domain-containing protein [Pseudoalteromonas]MBE0367276.1 two-component system, LytT family, response regulator AlgR [Pseudoalteromonas aurantia 208]MBQ4848770.1 response regulator transcription factor [Pseudoalteromonas sp. MMG012]